MVKAGIDFKKKFWIATNELCGAVTENYFKNYIFLPLAFEKDHSKSYEVVHDEHIEQVKDPNSNYYTTDTRRDQLPVSILK